jgi:small subunit ribosomal protein S1
MSQELELNELMTDDLEQELARQLSEDSMESLFDEAVQNFKEGEVVTGKVMEIGDDRVLVDIGYKSEGVVDKSEFAQPSELSTGDVFDFYIDDPENDQGMPILSKFKADRIKNWEKVQTIYEDDGVIEGTITRRVKGGLKVDIGIDAFMPASQLTFRPTGDLERYIGEKMELKIIKLTKRRRNVVVSRRKLLEEQRADEKEKLLTAIEVGQILKGEVKNITDFGAFVDVGGIDGLLHVTDMSWGRVKHPSQIVQVGQELDVKVLSFDPQSERISLGLKQNTENPWLTAIERYPIGGVARGRIVSMTDYGAFIQLEEGIEGMVHVSEMSWTRRVRHPNELIQLGDEVDVMILTVDAGSEKIALGIKQTQPNPWQQLQGSFPIDSTVKGTIRNLTEYGAFVQLADGIDGLLHVSDLSWTKKVTHPSEMLEKGQEIEVKVLSIDPDAEKISVGLKQLETDPWLAVVEKLPIGMHIEVEIAKLVSFGAFARLESGIEGLIHVSELSSERIQKPEEVLKIGDKVMTKVISINPADRKIGLSMREFERDHDKSLMTQHSDSEDGGKVDVKAAMRTAMPESMLEAGRSLADVAHEMMAAVNAAQQDKQTAAAAASAPEEAPAEEAAPVSEEAPASEETLAPEAAAVTDEAPVPEETPADEAAPVTEEAPAEEAAPASEEAPADEATPVAEASEADKTE